jgi:acetyl-CoA synthetase
MGATTARHRRPERRPGMGPLVDRRLVRLVVGCGRAASDARSGRDRHHLGRRTWDIRHVSNRDLALPSGALRSISDRSVSARGDRVGILLPMLIETVVAVLAGEPHRGDLHADLLGLRLRRPSRRASPTARRRCSSPRMGSYAAWSWVDLKSVADAAVASVPSVRHVVVVPRAGDALDVPWTEGRDVPWAYPAEETDVSAEPGRDPETPIHDHLHLGDDRPAERRRPRPWWDSRSRRRRISRHTFDLTERDTLFWFTDLGWMMGPWAIAGSLLLGARLVLYEGRPRLPRSRPPVVAWSSATRSPISGCHRRSSGH